MLCEYQQRDKSIDAYRSLIAHIKGSSIKIVWENFRDTRNMFSLGEISEQLKDVSRKSIGVSFAGQSLVLDTANDGKMLKSFR